MNDTLFIFYGNSSDETRIDKNLQKSQVLGRGHNYSLENFNYKGI